jgi:hypothetical protein
MFIFDLIALRSVQLFFRGRSARPAASFLNLPD